MTKLAKKTQQNSTSRTFYVNNISARSYTLVIVTPIYSRNGNVTAIIKAEYLQIFFSLKSTENTNIKPGPEMQYSFIKKRVYVIHFHCSNSLAHV